MKTKLCLLLVGISFLLSVQTMFAQKETKLQKKLRTIIIDHLELEDASVEAVIKLIRIRAKNLDPEKQGINIMLFLEPPKKKAKAQKKKAKKRKNNGVDIIEEAIGANEKTVTLMFEDIALGNALKNICRAANLVYKVEQYAVVIAHKDFPISKMQTKIFPVDPDAYLQIKDRLKSIK